MARLMRFERMTYGLEGRCSILLSYRRFLGVEFSGLLILYIF